jgi:hypothetical protein
MAYFIFSLSSLLNPKNKQYNDFKFSAYVIPNHFRIYQYIISEKNRRLCREESRKRLNFGE